ncbi:uncharacterized protein ZBAI_03029 [Zygosaccharomyces bailii ISA1307]|nr:uncharacterized protein ZBAI_03029 [Zygosaccharomyces bailii ISA1307]
MMIGAAAVPEYRYPTTSSPLSDSSNSMIFERNVEEPCSVPSRPYSRQGSSVNLLSRQYSNRSCRTSQGNLSSPRSPLEQDYASPVCGQHRRQLENCVAPALDASCSIIADDSANLDDLDVVYMRRPSTIGLDMALGRTRSNSYATLTDQQKQLRQTQPGEENPRTLKFYSYADVLSDEAAAAGITGPPGTRPALSHSASSTYLRPPLSGQQPASFSNPFVKRRDSGAGGLSLGRRYSNNVLSRSPTNQSQTAGVANTSGAYAALAVPRGRVARARQQTNFQMESSGSEDFSTDEEDETPFTPQQHWGLSPLGPRVSRTSTQNSMNSNCSARARSYSNSSPSLARRRESGPSSISGLLMEDTLQTEKVGDILKKRISRREA